MPKHSFFYDTFSSIHQMESPGQGNCNFGKYKNASYHKQVHTLLYKFLYEIFRFVWKVRKCGKFRPLINYEDVWGSEGMAQPFLNSTPDVAELSVSRPPPRYPLDTRLGGPRNLRRRGSLWIGTPVAKPSELAISASVYKTQHYRNVSTSTGFRTHTV